MAQGFDEQTLKDETIAATALAMGWPTGETPIAYTRRVGVL
tara:strand:+ start:125 stop:247 length:123 start_codon:yes stop_codon:yes gene_type:complete